MSKYLKSLIIACLVVCMTVCLGIFAAACTGNPDDSGNSGEDNNFTYPSAINVTVLLEDGTPASGVSVQICTVSDDGTADSANCKRPQATNAQGVSSVAIEEKDGYKFEVHLSIPTTYKGYSYVDANGTPYASGTGARIDVRESADVTVKLDVVGATKISVGGTEVELEAITDTYTVKANIENAGWYRLSSVNAFSLSGVGFALSDAHNQVSTYLKPNSVLTLTFTDENELSFELGLTAIGADGTEAKPLPADLESAYVISLEANKTVYITNNTNNSRPMPLALDVSGTNFKANYESTDYTETFTLKAPDNAVPQTFSVGTADGTAGVVALYFGEHVEMSLGSENNPYTAELDVAITAQATYYIGYYVTFTATVNGVYQAVINDDTFAEDPTYTYEDLDNIELNAGESITVIVYAAGEDDSGNRTITFTQKA